MTGAAAQQPVDGDGTATVVLTDSEDEIVEQLAERTASDATSNPMTGAEIGIGVQTEADTETTSTSTR